MIYLCPDQLHLSKKPGRSNQVPHWQMGRHFQCAHGTLWVGLSLAHIWSPMKQFCLTLEGVRTVTLHCAQVHTGKHRHAYNTHTHIRTHTQFPCANFALDYLALCTMLIDHNYSKSVNVGSVQLVHRLASVSPSQQWGRDKHCFQFSKFSNFNRQIEIFWTGKADRYFSFTLALIKLPFLVWTSSHLFRNYGITVIAQSFGSTNVHKKEKGELVEKSTVTGEILVPEIVISQGDARTKPEGIHPAIVKFPTTTYLWSIRCYFKSEFTVVELEDDGSRDQSHGWRKGADAEHTFSLKAKGNL